jgi:Flp pilus assembly protein TadD
MSRSSRDPLAFSSSGIALQKGDLEEARRRLVLIPESSFAAAQKHDLLGDILLHGGRTDEAVSAYRRSLAINAGQRIVYRKLIRILERSEPAEAERLRRELAWVESFYHAPIPREPR